MSEMQFLLLASELRTRAKEILLRAANTDDLEAQETMRVVATRNWRGGPSNVFASQTRRSRHRLSGARAVQVLGQRLGFLGAGPQVADKQQAYVASQLRCDLWWGHRGLACTARLPTRQMGRPQGRVLGGRSELPP
jgi:hypothetical protein